MNYKDDLKYLVFHDYPTKGVRFIDLTPTILDGHSFDSISHELVKQVPKDVDYIVAPEARGFIWGAAVAKELRLPLITIRKPYKLPDENVGARVAYKTEYSDDVLDIPKVDLGGKTCYMIDDVYALGGTYSAAEMLVKERKGKMLGGSVVYDVGIDRKNKKVKSLYRGDEL